MNNKNISLREAMSRLQSAVEKEDWEAAERLDHAIRQEINEAVSVAGTSKDNAELIAMLKKIQSLYDQIIKSSEQARSKFSQELKKVSNDNKAANFYLKSSQYR